MTTSHEGNRNLVLAVHFGEGDERTLAEARAHVAGCAECRQYGAVLSQVEAALLGWPEEPPPPGLRDRVLARATRAARGTRAPRPASDAMPLLALVPVMAAVVAAIRSTAAWLSGLGAWPSLAEWPLLQVVAPPFTATAMLLALGALATLALAPALVLESGGGPRWPSRSLGLRG